LYGCILNRSSVVVRLGGLGVLEVVDPKESRKWVRACGEKSKVLAEVELHVFRGATLWVACDGQEPVSYNVTRFGKRRKNVWEPYSNWYTAYTINSCRRRGHARRLALYVRSLARDAGCRRLKSLAGTRLGLYLHAALGDEFWGVTSSLEVVIDTPLVLVTKCLGCVPPNAAPVLREKAARDPPVHIDPMSLGDVLKELGERPMRYER
jgi:GNAT superfamily N-acetyltransferase